MKSVWERLLFINLQVSPNGLRLSVLTNNFLLLVWHCEGARVFLKRMARRLWSDSEVGRRYVILSVPVARFQSSQGGLIGLWRVNIALRLCMSTVLNSRAELARLPAMPGPDRRDSNYRRGSHRARVTCQ